MKLKAFPFFLLLIWASSSYAQKNFLAQYHKGDSLLKSGNYLGAYELFKDLENKCSPQDTLYAYIQWNYNASVTFLEKSYRNMEDWNNSLKYGLEAMALIEKGKEYNPEKFRIKEYWMIKNIIVSCFGLNELDKAKEYQKKLYEGYKKKDLPEGLNEYYNFEFFKWKGNNVWGYEWYPELGDPETEGSFSKIVYYVYSTHPDGSDKDQLYRLHVLKFHKIDKSIKFDYVLTKRLETATNEKSGTYYDYTYERPIDYVKLRKDIREVLNGNYKPGAKSEKKKE